MITRKELIDVLEEIGNEVILLSADHKRWAYKRFEEHDLVEHEPTAKEKYSLEARRIVNEQKDIDFFTVRDLISLADNAIRKAEEGARG